MIREEKISYCDYNATTPIDPRVLEAMLPLLDGKFAYASSTHHFGQRINVKVKEARVQIADFINAETNELIFTCGTREVINITIKGVADSYSNKGKHIITVSTELKAVLGTCKELERKGFEVTYFSVSPKGLTDLAELQKSFRPDTILLSVMYVNNKTVVIQPIKEIATLTCQIGGSFMTDGSQAVGTINVDDIGIDLLCFNGHKIDDPTGIGDLYVKEGGNKEKLTLQIHGGGLKQGLRSGTINVAGIIARAKACEIASNEMVLNQRKISALRDKLETELLKLLNTSLNGDSENRIYNATNFC